jgi:predicted metalloenzyme YecM
MDGPTYTNHRIYCLYVIEDEYGRQFLMYFGDDVGLSSPHVEHESLLNKSLAFVNAIADIVKQNIEE